MHATLPALVIDRLKPLPALPTTDTDRAAAFARQDKALTTRKAYRSDFAGFQASGTTRGVDALPAIPETVAAYLASEAEAGGNPSTTNSRPIDEARALPPRTPGPEVTASAESTWRWMALGPDRGG